MHTARSFVNDFFVLDAVYFFKLQVLSRDQKVAGFYSAIFLLKK